jgi:hypothetical protein
MVRKFLCSDSDLVLRVPGLREPTCTLNSPLSSYLLRFGRVPAGNRTPAVQPVTRLCTDRAYITFCTCWVESAPISKCSLTSIKYHFNCQFPRPSNVPLHSLLPLSRLSLKFRYFILFVIRFPEHFYLCVSLLFSLILFSSRLLGVECNVIRFQH